MVAIMIVMKLRLFNGCNYDGDEIKANGYNFDGDGVKAV